ncbi:hypothetical protein [Stenotrophomonas maltophilia]|uniref:hypothetical protein n=3 Tax=Stenotrophomonas maltophilia TaxID=40324 RepID=UPI0018D405F3|nr:hypothetical protein [Stenotrophomonas maltophilia]MBH1622412.1 hypothetical protein [Stenotrophomonas maltophilia]
MAKRPILMNGAMVRASLADVQPGGRVRLGDQAERARFEAWVKNHVSSLARAADGEYASNFTHALWSAWQAALSAQPHPPSSFDLEAMLAACVPGGDIADPQVIADNIRHWFAAQPSPGGQGDAPEIEQIRTLVSSILSTVSLGHQKGAYAYSGEDFGRYLAEATRDCRAILRALSDLAARQPVYEGHTWVSDYVLAGLRERAAMPLQLRNGEVWHWQGDGHDFPESLVCPVIMSAETLRALLAARQPSKQPDSVALGEATEFCIENGARQPVGQEAVVTSHWRDGRLNHILYCSPMPDGVHRLYAAPPAQAVDLSQFRDALVWAEDAADCSSHPDHKAYRFAFTELLGMIDSQAVGNG